MTVKKFKKNIEERCGVSADEMQLHQGGKQWEDDKMLGSYPNLSNLSNIFIVFRLKGGSKPFTDTPRNLSAEVSRSKENCTIYAVCGGTSPVAKMPCGHPVCAGCLMYYAWSEVTNNKAEIQCFMCKTLWTLPIVKKYGNATRKEMELLEEGLTKNAFKLNPDIWECPGCNNFCTRMDTTIYRVFCGICNKIKKTEDYCCKCLRTWKNGNSKVDCGHDDCFAGSFKSLLNNAPMVSSSYLPGVKFPSKRACVECGLVIEHIGGCKHMMCTLCRTVFCFVCLKRKVDGSSPCGNHNTVCALAPIQQDIPSRRR